MSLPISGSILVKKVNENNDFVESLLIAEDLNAVTVTGTQNISGKKTFTQSITSSGIECLDTLTIKTHPGFSGSDLTIITSGIQTTDNTQTTIASIPIEEGYAYWFEVFTIGRNEDTPRRIRMEVNRASAYREVAGSATLIGTVANDVSRSLLAGAYGIDIGISGNNLVVLVDGDAGQTVNWVTTVYYQKVSTNI